MYRIKKQGNQITVELMEAMTWQQWLYHIWLQTQLRCSELINYRELIRNLVIRDLKVRYKDSILGVLWSLLHPLLMMIVFTTVFTVLQNKAIDKFPAFILVGLLPWQFFNDAVSAAKHSIVSNSHLINKVYFPREVLVITNVLSHFVNFLIALLVLVPILFIFDVPFTYWALLLPVMILIQVIFTLGISLIVATANVFYRDVGMIVSVGLLAGFFLTPIFYPLETLPRSYELFGVEWNIWRLMYYLNPMASIIENYRRILFYGTQPAFDFVFRTFLTAVVFLAVGLVIFYRNSARFGEIV